MSASYDAVVVGAGPNGLAAAVEIARNGRSVLVLEAADEMGGGARTRELTLPGFRHDVCSAVHPLGIASPFFASLPLAEHGLEWIHPPIPAAHPLDDGPAGVLHRSLEDTAAGLGADHHAYRDTMGPLLAGWDAIAPAFLGPVFRFPRRPVPVARFGLLAVRSAEGLRRRFDTAAAQALVAGMAAHSIAPLDRPFTAGVALTLMMAGHHAGWPVAAGGSQSIVAALAAHLRSLGGRIEVQRPVRRWGDLPSATAVVFATSAWAVVDIAGDRLPPRYRRAVRRFRPGPGSYKVDWALSGPIPWTSAACAAAGTVHLGGTFAEVASAERNVVLGRHPERPFVLLAQPSRFDPSRAPVGRHVAWAYCHVPNGSSVDMTGRIEAQVERFAPGFRDLILERHVMGPAELEGYNPSYRGGDIATGAITVRQVLARPVFRLNPHRTPNGSIYLGSAAAPPGPGVHGMSGYHAARAALRHSLR